MTRQRPSDDELFSGLSFRILPYQALLITGAVGGIADVCTRQA